MAAPYIVSVFIPHQTLNELSLLYLYGHIKISSSNVLINCTIGIRTHATSDYAYKLYEKSHHSHEGKSKKFCSLGILYKSKKKKNFTPYNLQSDENPVSFVIRTQDFNAFYVEKMIIKSLNSVVSCQVVLYDSSSLLRSRLLEFGNSYSLGQRNNFITFLLETCVSNAEHFKCLVSDPDCETNNLIEITSQRHSLFSSQDLCFTFLFLPLFLQVSKLVKIVSSVSSWLHHVLFKTITFTHVGRQLHQRFLHCERISIDIRSKNALSLRCKNLISVILFDFICGWIVVLLLVQSSLPLKLLDSSIEQTNFIVSSLQKLIHWLMGAPAGLKLNIPLNSTLGHFFLYHIYLWEAYMAVVLPVFTFIFKISTVIGILGVTFVLCLINDLVSLATVHIYCFYGYATRLYGYQVSSLSALWRLFRGKKWNPLRQRVDSYTYDIHQLFLGTLLFTVLLFLLPTVMVYYFVFTCLRIMVLIIQGIISKATNAFTICPLYSFSSRLIRSSETAGDVFFTVVNTQGTLVLSMQTSQVPLSTVVKTTLPELYKHEEYLSWREFLSSITLYGYQVSSLSALWRLFRGKKWNPLRQRVDSYTYDIHQLFLGTLLFTVLLFLLPTVMVYYFVFTCLRIMVLIIQGIISKATNAFTICPLYSFSSRLTRSSETAGDVFFTVVNTQGTLVLSMHTSQVPLSTVVKTTLPELYKHEEYLSWREFLSSITWGKIIYPL